MHSIVEHQPNSLWPTLLLLPAFSLCLALFFQLAPTAGSTAPLPTHLLLLSALTAITMMILAWKIVCQQRRLQRYRQLAKRLVRLKRVKNREETRAMRILNHIVNPDGENVPRTDVWQNPLYGFSGDLAIVCEGPHGQIYTLLADLTGHGITAAMGAAPVASIFKATARRGMSVADIVQELNNKLHQLLPSGFFCCAAVLVTDRHKGTLSACNAGLPELIVVRDSGELQELIPSSQLPLGIQSVTANDVVTINREFSEPHQIYALTDGLIECPGPDPDLFDMENLVQCIASHRYADGRLTRIIDCRATLTQEIEPSDDITIVEVAIC